MTWTQTNNGKGQPLDPDPNKDGNVALVIVPGAGELSIALAGDALDGARQAGAKLYTSHFVTCPDAERFKGAGKNA